MDGTTILPTPTLTATPTVTSTATLTQTSTLTATPTATATHTSTPTATGTMTQPPPFSGASFTYDGDGNRVAQTISGVTTYFVGSHYEVTGSTVTKYYYAGAQRVAMRKGTTLSYLLSDHLGSTSLTLDDDEGTVTSELRYKAWGEVRYASGSTVTDYTFTGQFSNMDDFGLMFYNARWYDPSLGRFAQADTIVPGAGNSQAWDRYAYTNNNPLRYTDPSGHMVAQSAGFGGRCDANCRMHRQGAMKEKTLNVKVPAPKSTEPKPLRLPTLPLFCNGLEDIQGEVLSPRPIDSGGDAAEADTVLRGPNAPVLKWDYIIAAFGLKNYLETNADFRNIEYEVWNLPPDVTSGLYYTPYAKGIGRNDERGVLMTGLFVNNNFPEDIQRIDLEIKMIVSNSIKLAANQVQIFTPIQSGSSANLFGKPILVPTTTYQASVNITLFLYTSNYQGQITHTIP